MSFDSNRAYDSTLGVALIGLTLTSILYGFTSLQAFIYFNRYYKDSKLLKTTVSCIWFLDTFHTAIVLHILYFYLVTNYNNSAALELIVWSLALEVGLTTFVGVVVQIFFIWRVWILSSRNLVITGVIAILVFIAFLSGLGCMAETFLLGTIANLAKIEWLVGVKHGSIAAADIGIAGAQCWYLHFARTGTKRTDNLINTLMIYTINRGILNSVAAVADLACFLAMPENFIWLTFNLVMGKLYSNSLLATLNTRDALRGRGTDTDLESTRTTFHVSVFPHSRSGNTDSTGYIASKPTTSAQVETTRHREDDADAHSSLGIEYDAAKGNKQDAV